MLRWTALVAVLVGSSIAQPFWPHYPERSLQVLDGEWSFGFASNFNWDAADPAKIETPEKVMVPNAFDNADPGYKGKRGTGFYRKTVTTTPGKPLLLNFMACSFTCKVWVDGTLVGSHNAGGYTPFWLSAPASSSATREILVAADNRFDKTRSPVHTGGDFWHYGGLLRSLIVHEQPAVTYVKRVEIVPVDIAAGTVDVTIFLGGEDSKTVDLGLSFDGGETKTVKGLVVAKAAVKVASLAVPNPTLWSIDHPNLHTLSISLTLPESDVASDVVVSRFGLRAVGKNDAGRITLNGEQVKLHGYNRHSMEPATGAANSLEEIKADLAIFREIGANFLRGGHYPQDQRLLDLCDEMGIAVWEETLGPGVGASETQSTAFMTAQKQQIHEMIDASFNHPSVMFWAFFNEGACDVQKACPGYKACADTIRSRDTKRFVTWASNRIFNDKCIESANADVVAFNDYPGWYGGTGNLTYPEWLWNSHADGVAKKWPGRPFLISETGCEGLWEWRNESAVIWSQTYQNIILKGDVNAALTNQKISGIALWVFADFKGNDEAQDACGPCPYAPGTHDATFVNVNCTSTWGSNLGNRPCGENHKGTVDWWRRKKEVFPIIQGMFKDCSGHC